MENKRYINNIFDLHRFDGVINLTAETHVDNSIEHPDIFLQTNVIGTQTLINASIKYGINKFVQVSTDEVYGSLDFDDGRKFYEFTPFDRDRPGHDLRYSVNFDKIYTKLRWKPEINFNLGMKETIKSYLQ